VLQMQRQDGAEVWVSCRDDGCLQTVICTPQSHCANAQTWEALASAGLQRGCHQPISRNTRRASQSRPLDCPRKDGIGRYDKGSVAVGNMPHVPVNGRAVHGPPGHVEKRELSPDLECGGRNVVKIRAAAPCSSSIS
jgi:hypothetical protein